MIIMCEYWFAELSRASLAKHHNTKKVNYLKPGTIIILRLMGEPI